MEGIVNITNKKKGPGNLRAAVRLMNPKVAKANSIRKPKQKPILIQKSYKSLRAILNDGQAFNADQEKLYTFLINSGIFNSSLIYFVNDFLIAL